MARQQWHNKGSGLFTDYCGVSGRSVDEQYVDARVDLYSGRPLFIGNTQIEEWARDLGMDYPAKDYEVLEKQNALLIEALTRWEQIFNVLGSVGITLSDDLNEYVSSIRPSLDAIRKEVSGSGESDRHTTEDDREITEQSPEFGTVHVPSDGTDDSSIRSGIKLGL